MPWDLRLLRLSRPCGFRRLDNSNGQSVGPILEFEGLAEGRDPHVGHSAIAQNARHRLGLFGLTVHGQGVARGLAEALDPLPQFVAVSVRGVASDSGDLGAAGDLFAVDPRLANPRLKALGRSEEHTSE